MTYLESNNLNLATLTESIKKDKNYEIEMIKQIEIFEKKALDKNFSNYTELHYSYENLAKYYYALGKDYYDSSLIYCLKDFNKLDLLDKEASNFLTSVAKELNYKIAKKSSIKFPMHLTTVDIAFEIFNLRSDFVSAIDLCNLLIKTERNEFKKNLEAFEINLKHK